MCTSFFVKKLLVEAIGCGCQLAELIKFLEVVAKDLVRIPCALTFFAYPPNKKEAISCALGSGMLHERNLLLFCIKLVYFWTLETDLDMIKKV